MGKIGLLDLSVANLIAAGEVVDRPASVVKELMENSIDAGATEITVEIKNGGIALMRVSDNGCGMTREDAVLCISRHATSKIHTAADLDGICTLGFRGEALAAISSVSSLRIMTRRKEDAVGTMVQVECGQICSVEDAGCRAGTTLVVEELFHNVPARRKFLKKDTTEAMAITAVVEKIALSHPDIAVKLIVDGQMKLCTAGDGKLYGAIYALLGRDFATRMIPVHTMSDGIEVSGFIGRPDNVRVNRNYQNFFINGRYVKSRTAAAALEQAFSSYLESEKFPCCVLGLNIHPSLVDVNVHPTKLEVKFSNERVVFDAVYCAVRGALQSDESRPEMKLKKDTAGSAKPEVTAAPKPAQSAYPYGGFAPVYERGEQKPAQTPLRTFPRQQASAPVSEPVVFYPPTPAVAGASADVIPFSPLPEKQPERMPEPILPPQSAEKERQPAEKEPETKKTAEAAEAAELPPFEILGTAFGTYLIVEVAQKLLMIDKHAAHERILFEKMKKNLEAGMDRFSQILLLPEELALSPEELAAAALYEKEVTALGFAYTVGEKSVTLTQMPGGISFEQGIDLFTDICGRLASGEGSEEISRSLTFEKALYQASCKAAVKAGGGETPEQLRPIVEELLRIPNLRYCPHGRPVAFEISKGSIEHQFKRS